MRKGLVTCPRSPIKNTCYRHDLLVDFDHGAEVLFARFLHCKLTLFSPSPHCTPWKEATMCSLLLMIRNLCSSSLGWSSPHKLFGMILHRKFFSCILLNQSFVHTSMNLQRLILYYGLNSLLSHFAPQTVPTLAIGSSFSCPVLFKYTSVEGDCFCFCF